MSEWKGWVAEGVFAEGGKGMTKGSLNYIRYKS